MAGAFGPRSFRIVTGVAFAGPLSLLFGVGGLYAGAFGGPVIRLALAALGGGAGGPIAHVEHDILVGCAVGVVAGALAAVRLVASPPAWVWWAR